jgi:PHD/YefM family antitoxin component YafN of YafNO toxin-antitoxin module
MVNEQYVVDAAGNRSAVLIDVDRYFQLLEAEEELDSIRAFDTAKASDDDAIPFEQAIKEIDDAQ